MVQRLVIGTLLLLLWPLFARGGEPYPVGVEQGSAVGGRRTGWVHITHWVTREKGEYVYHVSFACKTASRCRFTWELPGEDGEPVAQGVEIEPGGDYEATRRSDRPPARQAHLLTLEIREGGKWRRAGRWWQAGPVPVKESLP